MAEIVGPDGRLVGLDASESMIVEARRRASENQRSVTFEVGDVEALRICGLQRNGWARPILEVSMTGSKLTYDHDVIVLTCGASS